MILNSFNEKIKKVEELYGYHVPKINYQQESKNLIDYTNYFNQCEHNISKCNYLQKRGIAESLIKKYKIGYDMVKNCVIFPINKNCYFARNIINNDKIKSKGNSDIWNQGYLFDTKSNSHIYVTEGIIDSLSLETIDSSVKMVLVIFILLSK